MADPKKKESKWFRICTAGETSDGRVITEQDILDAAETYNPKEYGARVNLEHIRGLTPDSPFRMYGDVLELKSEVQDGKLRLLSKISPTDEAVVMVNKDRQKVFTSCELQPNFANSGKTYLVGLALTDSPASLGCEMLEFSARQGDKSPLAGRKLDAGNLFTVAQETQIEFVDAESAPSQTTLLTSAIQALTSIAEKFSKPVAPITPAPEAKPADMAAGEANAEVGKFMAETVKLFGDLQAAVVPKAEFTALQEKFTALDGQFNALKTRLEEESGLNYTARDPATGGDAAGYIQIDG